MGQPLRFEDFEDFIGHPLDSSDIEFMRKANKFLAGAILCFTTFVIFQLWL